MVETQLDDAHGVEGALGARGRKRHATSALIERRALELMAERGFDSVTADDIAKAAGISRRTYFRYFPGGKEDVVLCDARRRMERMEEDLEARPPHEPPLVALRHAIMTLAVGYEDDRDLTALRGEILLSNPSLTTAFMAEVTRVNEDFVRTVALRLAADPSVDPRPGVIVAASLGAVQVAFAMWMRGADESLQSLVTQALDIVDGGLENAGQRVSAVPES
jgi:AcrR family transcriptional regulator